MKKYSDIIPAYADYENAQKVSYCSFESSNTHWAEGQRRYILQNFSKIPREARILDIACGDGVGLKEFKTLGFTAITGVEFNSRKVELAQKFGYRIFPFDMHHLPALKDGSFDFVYSSHTLEHAYEPVRALMEMRRVLADNGLLFLVLPFPDMTHGNLLAHGAKFELGTDKDNQGESLCQFLKNCGFSLVEKSFDTFREPEIWLKLRKG